MRLICFTSLLVAAIPLIQGCTHVEYSRGASTVAAQNVEAPDSNTDTYDFAFDRVHELQLLDHSGAVCAGLATALDEANSYMDARSDAIKDNALVFKYEYRVHSPAEYVGMTCGAWARWSRLGEGSQALRFIQNDDPSDLGPYETVSLDGVSFREGGFQMGGAGLFSPKVSWLRWSLLIRMGMGRYKLAVPETADTEQEYWAKKEGENFYVRVPTHFGLLIYPAPLFGLGVEAYGGWDPVSMLFTNKMGTRLQKTDYTLRAAYTFSHDNFAVSAYGEKYHHNYAWGDFWAVEDGWRMGGSFGLSF